VPAGPTVCLWFVVGSTGQLWNLFAFTTGRIPPLSVHTSVLTTTWCVFGCNVARVCRRAGAAVEGDSKRAQTR